MDKFEDLCGQLWDATETDWSIHMFNVITEPVCFFVSLHPDSDKFPKFENILGTYCPLESACMAIEYVLKNLKVERA